MLNAAEKDLIIEALREYHTKAMKDFRSCNEETSEQARYFLGRAERARSSARKITEIEVSA